MMALGFRAVPVTAVGDRAVQGFDVEALCDLLNLGPRKGGAFSPDELLAKYRLVFEAARKAILQIPEDKLDWVTPGRKRTLRQLTFHIFDRAEAFVSLVHGGEFTEEMTDDYMASADSCQTTRDIAAYGERVLAQVEDILTRRRELLDKAVKTYFGTCTTYDLLNRALSMAAFRLNGTYRYLRRLGVEPVAPLGPDDFAGIAMPPGNP